MAWEPTKPVTVVIGFAPGSGNELGFRGVAKEIEKAGKVSFIIENRPGADGVVGMNHFITQPSDGYTIYVPSHQGIWVTADYFQKQVKKYTLDDFEYGLTLGKSPLAVIVSSTSSVRTVPDMLNKLKNTTKPINFAAGSGAHRLAFNYMMDKMNYNKDLIQSVTYKGPMQAATDVAGSQVEFGIVPAAVAHQLEQSGKIRIVALCSEQRLASLPDVDLMSKYIPGMNVYAAWGIIFPKGTPQVIVDWYVKEFTAAIKSPESKRFFNDNLMFVAEQELTPKGFRDSMSRLRAQWIPVIEKLPAD